MKAALGFLVLAGILSVAGVYVLAGLGWSLIVAGLCNAALALLCVRGAKANA